MVVQLCIWVCLQLLEQISRCSAMVDITNLSSDWLGTLLRRKNKAVLNLEPADAQESGNQSMPVKKPRRNYSNPDNFNALMKGLICCIFLYCCTKCVGKIEYLANLIYIQTHCMQELNT